MRRNRVAAARHAIGVNARSTILAGNLATGAAPCVIQRMLGIEVAGGSRCRRGLAHHDFTGIDGATCGNRRPGLLAAKHKCHASLQSYASDISGGNNRRRAKLMIRVYEISSEQAHSEVSAQVQIETAASHEPGYVIVPEDFGS